jgi:hypothetical protein
MPRAKTTNIKTTNTEATNETENLLLLDDTVLTEAASVTDPEPLQQQDVDIVAVQEPVVSEVVANPCQQAMLAIAKQNEYRETKAMDEIAERQARFNLDNHMAQNLAAIPQNRERLREANRRARKPKQLQEPLNQANPAKGVVFIMPPDLTPEEPLDGEYVEQKTPE